jgi:hypothetical protein
MIPPLKPPREALSISGYATINNFDENIDDSLATLDNIGIMTINNVNGSLITRQGASFDVLLITIVSLRAMALRSTLRQTSCQTGETAMATLVASSFTPLLSIATSGGKSKK